MYKLILIFIFILFIIFILKNNYNNIFYEDFNSSKTKIKVYNYYTTWCGWSKKFLKEWNIFKTKIEKLDYIEAIDVICDDQNTNNKCFTVPGYPYVCIEKNNNECIPYEGERTGEKLLDFINNLK